MAVSEAIENYLETILVLSKKKPELHAVDICAELGYSRPTLSVVLKKMRDEGLIIVDDLNHIAMTEKGREIAEAVYERHTILAKMLMSFGVSKEAAQRDACKMEHDISDESFECIKKIIGKKPD
ncbi:MAG: metal-dependent transcriptional regulator [Ruminiclostridium sp.]